LNPGHPKTDEYAAFYAGYVAKAQGVTDPVMALESQLRETVAFLKPFSPAQQNHRYAEGKWSVKEVINHLTDSERIFSYRALCVGRNDKTPLPPFDENPYVAAAEAGSIEWGSLLSEFEAVRQSTMQLLRNLPDEAWTRVGVASGFPISVRALTWIIYGHVAHHLGIVRERYL
jgi:uncharacterized damage-inducible protein DinB